MNGKIVLETMVFPSGRSVLSRRQHEEQADEIGIRHGRGQPAAGKLEWPVECHEGEASDDENAHTVPMAVSPHKLAPTPFNHNRFFSLAFSSSFRSGSRFLGSPWR